MAEKPVRFPYRILWFLFMFMLPLAFYSWLGHNSPTEEIEKACGNDGKINVYDRAKQHVTERLNYPTTASFPSFSDSKVNVRWLDRCKFHVAGYVDEQNGFGAIIRSSYEIDLTLKSVDERGEHWSSPGPLIVNQ